MELLVLGASGRCGRLIAKVAIERGHRVTAVVRPGSEGRVPPGADLVIAEVADSEALAELLDAHQVVLCALGLNRDGLSPWSKLRSPPRLVEGVARVVDAKLTQGSSLRLVWISAGGVGPSYASTTWPIRRMIELGNVGIAYDDLRQAERVLRGHPNNSFPIRPVTLLPGDNGKAARRVRRYGLFTTVRRGAVARYMVDVAEQGSSLAEPPLLVG